LSVTWSFALLYYDSSYFSVWIQPKLFLYFCRMCKMMEHMCGDWSTSTNLHTVTCVWTCWWVWGNKAYVVHVRLYTYTHTHMCGDWSTSTNLHTVTCVWACWWVWGNKAYVVYVRLYTHIHTCVETETLQQTRIL
jgi:hypothetical protein